MNLSNLFRYGSLVRVEYRSWEASRHLTGQDLGYEEGDFRFKAGRKNLIDHTILKGLSSMQVFLYRCQNEYTTPFFLFNARFVPHCYIADFTARMDKLSRMFQNRKEFLLANYEGIKLQARPSMVKEAEHAYTRHRKLVKKPKERETFINDFLNMINELYPKPEVLKTSMRLEYYFFQIGYADLNHMELPADQQHIQERLQQISKGTNAHIDQCLDNFINLLVAKPRAAFHENISYIYGKLKAGRKYCVSTELMIKKSLRIFYKMDLANDKKMRDRMHAFESRFISKYQAVDFRENRYLRNNLINELDILASVAKKQEELQEVAHTFKKTIGII